MLRSGRPIGRIVIAAVLVAAALSPALAGDRLDLSAAAPGVAGSAETGKPPTRSPAGALPEQSKTCLPPLPCGSALYGAVRKNGAVELQVPALRW